jgi:uncharacterized protein (TIGR02001 family)
MVQKRAVDQRVGGFLHRRMTDWCWHEKCNRLGKPGNPFLDPDPLSLPEKFEMKKLIAAAGLAALASSVPSLSAAQSAAATPAYTFTANANLVSEYRYRGIAQTNAKPAVQGGFDYTHAGGFYLGTWASNVSWLSDGGAGQVSNSLEWDFYGGFKQTVGDFGYDIGLLQYYYPGSYPSGFNSPNTLELYVAGSWKMLTLKYSHALTDVFGFTDSKNGNYTDLTGNFDIGYGTTLVAHAGYQYIPGTTGRSSSDCSYSDWKLGLAKEMIGLSWGLSYIDTNAKGDEGQCYRSAMPYNRDLGKGTVVLSVGKTF